MIVVAATRLPTAIPAILDVDKPPSEVEGGSGSEVRVGTDSMIPVGGELEVESRMIR